MNQVINFNSPVTQAISFWKLYLEDQGRSIHTIKAFISDVNLLASFFPPDREIGEVTTKDINNFLDWMQNKRGIPCSPKTLSRRITSIKSFFKWLQTKGVITMDPAEKVVQKSVISPLPKVLSLSEINLLLDSANKHRVSKKPDARAYTLIKLLLETAIKKGECLTLTTNHIDFDAPNGPIIFIRYASPQNRYKERKIALSEEWIASFNEYKSQYDLTEKLFPWSQRRLEYILEEIGKEAGLENQVSFLMCRWSSALLDLDNGIESNKIRQKLGISKIQWREIYGKLRKLQAQSEPNLVES
ncbi:MAG: site-specific integrase [Chloroflexi bacterium]|jgi:site-specific recombinase XerD|nr:site-specific integrase [Chloroflexota bacterium]MBT3669364.1 site-specific integrase [Chloroflexota bacterium]MBT4001816.1 site-specific integrase [Chloroflexota bacterium]MBT4304617.1 site-specific integrase [Chloroflexota bacterium]MBT4534042.1 site-specific integrase [Chloroflexota bacterium]